MRKLREENNNQTIINSGTWNYKLDKKGQKKGKLSRKLRNGWS